MVPRPREFITPIRSRCFRLVENRQVSQLAQMNLNDQGRTLKAGVIWSIEVDVLPTCMLDTLLSRL